MSNGVTTGTVHPEDPAMDLRDSVGMHEFRAVVIVTWRSPTLSDAVQEIEGALDDLKRANSHAVRHLSVSRVEDLTSVDAMRVIARSGGVPTGTGP